MKPTKAKKIPNTKLKIWVRNAGTPYRDAMLDLAGTTLGMLRQWTSGRRMLSAESAGEIVNAMENLSTMFPDVPTPLNRGDLCSACAKCPHFKDSLMDVDDHK